MKQPCRWRKQLFGHRLIEGMGTPGALPEIMPAESDTLVRFYTHQSHEAESFFTQKTLSRQPARGTA